MGLRKMGTDVKIEISIHIYNGFALSSIAVTTAAGDESKYFTLEACFSTLISNFFFFVWVIGCKGQDTLKDFSS